MCNKKIALFLSFVVLIFMLTLASSARAAGYDGNCCCGDGTTIAVSHPSQCDSECSSHRGTNGFDQPSCTALPVVSGPSCPAPVNGACNSATNGQTFADAAALNAQSANLCNNGGAASTTSFSGNGPWTWTCGGTNNGTPSGTCTATKTVVGAYPCVVDPNVGVISDECGFETFAPDRATAIVKMNASTEQYWLRGSSTFTSGLTCTGRAVVSSSASTIDALPACDVVATPGVCGATFTCSSGTAKDFEYQEDSQSCDIGLCYTHTTWKCSNTPCGGTLSDFPFNYPANTRPAHSGGVGSCLINWADGNQGVLSNGASIQAYSQGTYDCHDGAASETRTCANGVLSGSYGYYEFTYTGSCD